MNQSNPEKLPGKPRILVAPLDWGLGHATRCIPIIRELLAAGAAVWLAGEGAQEKLLKNEFPGLPFLQLPGYRVQYSKTPGGLLWKMIGQTSQLKKAIRTEHNWLKQAVAEYRFDAVISDNRFGLYHASVPCIFITHQLNIKTGLGKWSERILQKWNYRYINRFTECWVPDLQGADNGTALTLADELSHPAKMPAVPVKYIGWLSRFAYKPVDVKKNHLLVVLSGPEPQRSLLEKKIMEELKNYNGTATIVRGLPGATDSIASDERFRFYDHLPLAELNAAMLEADYVISRTGYSTVMDIAALQKKSILIPTPGQTEQEYLAKELSAKKIAVTISQDKFSLLSSLTTANHFSFQVPPMSKPALLRDTVHDFLTSLS